MRYVSRTHDDNRSQNTTNQAARVSKELVDNDVVGNDPTDPIEVRHRLEDVVGEPIPAERAQKHEGKESLAADATTIAYAGILLLMKRVE